MELRSQRISIPLSGSPSVTSLAALPLFVAVLAEPLSVRLVPAGNAPQSEEMQLSRDELDVRYYVEPVVDLAELATEQVQLATPLKPLCRESCQGLCPRCGADLNQGLCACPKTTDSRWTPLLEWRKRD